MEEYQNHRSATSSLIDIIKTELDRTHPSSPTKTKPSSPTRPRKMSKPISPVRPRNTRRRSSTTSLEEDINAEQQLLRNLGISLPAEQHNDHAIAVSLQEALVDRMTKLNIHAKGFQETSETSVATHLQDAQQTLHLLMQSLLAETPYKTIRLLDSELEDAMAKLESRVDDIKTGMGNIDLEKLRVRNTKKEALVERWR
jgi:hypothetical protein